MKHTQMDEKKIKNLFQDENSMFIVPVYQREYAWEEDHCADLWYDLTEFAFPSNDNEAFDSESSEYCLGDLYTYFNDDRADELVDGQQRITSIILLLRAFYEELHENNTGNEIAKCIWYTNEDESVDITRPRIESKVITDKDKSKLQQILISGRPERGDKCSYAENYRFFQEKINEFKEQKSSDDLRKLAARVLKNVYVVRKRADTQEYAQQLFLTINSRGLSLSFDDIFKATLYQEFFLKGGEEEANAFDQRWGVLYDKCTTLFDHDKDLSEIAFAFWLRTHKDAFLRDWKCLGRYYAKNNFFRIKDPYTLRDIEQMIDFFIEMRDTNGNMFYSEELKRKIYILFLFNKNTMFHLLAILFFKNRNENGIVPPNDLNQFVDRVTAFSIGMAMIGNPFEYMKHYNVIRHISYFLGDTPDIDEKIFEKDIRDQVTHFLDYKPSRRRWCYNAILAWQLFKDRQQPLYISKSKLEIEHIFAKKLVNTRSMTNYRHVDLIGNCTLLESSLNKKAANLSFNDKAKLYTQGGKNKKGTINEELKRMAMELDDFNESNILKRTEDIVTDVIELLKQNDLLQH